MTQPLEKPNDAELLAWLDGDLTPERRAEIQRLLETDWELRTALARLEQCIGKYIEATQHQSPTQIEPFDDFWQRLAPQLHAMTALPPEPAQTPHWQTRWRAALRPTAFGWRWASGVTVTVLLVLGLIVYFLFSSQVRMVSAEELLQRSMQREDLRAQQLTDPVVYHKLQVRRGGQPETVLWESWEDARRKQFRQRVADSQGWRFLREHDSTAPPLLTELAQILRHNQMDEQRPLSATAFAAWRKRLRAQTESVTESRDGLILTVRSAEPYAVQQIREASLLFRKSDWHAVTLRLQVQGDGAVNSYELSEAAYEVVPLAALTVFADAAPLPLATITASTPVPAPTLAPAVAALAPTVTPATFAPTSAAWQEAEIAALFALHQMQADRGEQIEVGREAERQIVVRGLVETDARKEQLQAALVGLPLVVVRLQSVEEAVRQAPQQPVSSAPAPAPVPNAPAPVPNAPAPVPNAPAPVNANEIIADKAGKSAFEKRLAQYFIAQGVTSKNAERKITDLSDAVLLASSAALSDAWAMRRLAERFSVVREQELDATAQQRLAEMLRAHLTRLRQRTTDLRGRLEPVLTEIAGRQNISGKAAETHWQAQSLIVFQASERVREKIGQAFTGTAANAPEVAAGQILEALTTLEQALQSLSQQLNP
ncbi:MAG: hypothetical protein AB7O81_35075 [Blastocatellales bacterium]